MRAKKPFVDGKTLCCYSRVSEYERNVHIRGVQEAICKRYSKFWIGNSEWSVSEAIKFPSLFLLETPTLATPIGASSLTDYGIAVLTKLLNETTTIGVVLIHHRQFHHTTLPSIQFIPKYFNPLIFKTIYFWPRVLASINTPQLFHKLHSIPHSYF